MFNVQHYNAFTRSERRKIENKQEKMVSIYILLDGTMASLTYK